MAVVECVEPGSAFKPFVAAAALELGRVSPETIIDCHNGRWRAPGRILRDAHAYGPLTLRDVIVYSSNIGMAQVGMRLSEEQLYRALRRFGFGRETGIELTGETPGLLRPPEQWSKLSVASLSMGQEVACSALQLAAAFGVFANGGWYVPPRIVRGMGDADGRRVRLMRPTRPARRVLSKATADLMRADILADVVKRGTARRCKLEHTTMAGKTGTAQIARTNGRGYEVDAYTAVFVGIAPVEAPRIVAAVLAKRPSGKFHTGGRVAAPAVARTVERILSLTDTPRPRTCRVESAPPARQDG
jgi:cell division protein FtsI/penicillin-binding protein 2